MSDRDPLMSIGVFSTATLVSIKALRLYHEQGLLVPAWVDPVTGYLYVADWTNDVVRVIRDNVTGPTEGVRTAVKPDSK